MYLTVKERWLLFTDRLRLAITPWIKLVVDVGADLRRENLPVTNKVTALILNKYGSTNFRDIILTKRTANGSVVNLRKIHAYSPVYLPLTYPLLLPYS